MSNQPLKNTFTSEGKAELTRILQLLQEADKSFQKLNAVENTASLDFHNESGSLNHCIRWGLQAAEDLNEAVGNPEPPVLTIGETKTEFGVLAFNDNGVEHETVVHEKDRREARGLSNSRDSGPSR